MTARAEPCANRLMQVMAEDRVATGMSVRLVRSVAVATIAAQAEYDALYVDLEHGPLSIGESAEICMAALHAGITPLVRLPGIDAATATRVLDGGALGLIFPGVETAAQARTAVGLCRYAPAGTRSANWSIPQTGYLGRAD
jgi:2-keto-3-deoxy-L-rhamnonate aldolase RhmA